MASYGRRVDRAGLKAIFILPYVFVDTSEAWFEPRRHRIAISAAGPVSDFTIGGLFAVLATVVSGTTREVFFQLAFSAYIGALFNLNPFLDRDGYHILVDVLREPGLKKRAKAQFDRRMSGGGRRESDQRALARYSAARWSGRWSARCSRSACRCDTRRSWCRSHRSTSSTPSWPPSGSPSSCPSC
jgi:putative peptide zinc metalloprotease protein